MALKSTTYPYANEIQKWGTDARPGVVALKFINLIILQIP
jgi:hypothetical protein